MRLKTTFFVLTLSLMTASVSAQKYTNSKNVEVSKEYNGTTFTSTKTLSENIQNAGQFSYLTANEVKPELLEDILDDSMMYTVFLPSNEAFDALPEKTRKALLANRIQLQDVLKYHIIQGRLDSYSLKKAIEKNGGTAQLKTLQGEKLNIKEVNGQLILFDAQNNTATVSGADFYHKNGFAHIVDGLVFSSSN